VDRVGRWPVADAASRWIDVRYAVAAMVLGVASVVLGVLASVHDTFPGDEAMNATVRRLGGRFEPVAYVFNDLNAEVAFGVLGLVAVVWLRRGQWQLMVLAATAVALRPLLGLPKELVGRPRPAGDFPIREVVSDSSFPSGHVATVVVVFGVLFVLAASVVPLRLVWPVRALSVAVVVLTATSRMWAGVHWFSDTWGALFWGLTVVTAVLALRPGLAELERRVLGGGDASEAASRAA
jgi:membrane-associated phospholipid phosphatase